MNNKRYEGVSSVDWEKELGIQISSIPGKKEQHELIKKLGLPGMEFIILKKDKLKKAEHFIKKHTPVVVTVRYNNHKSVFLNVMAYKQFISLITPFREMNLREIYIGEEIQGSYGSYIGNALSNGKGMLLIEFYKKPYFTDIRELSSGFCEKKYLSHLYVVDFNNVLVVPANIPFLDLRYLVNELSGIYGYFEFIKGIKGKDKKEKIYFNQYENSPSFINYLGAESLLFKYEFNLRERVKILTLKHSSF